MKKQLLACTVFFGLLGILGACYVLSTGGHASPGYALIPMLICLICLQGYILRKKKDKDADG